MKHAMGWWQISSFGRRLARDEGGAVLIYVSIALTVFMGFAALVIDGARLSTLDTEMQSAADALALAGAAELDGNADAITRADAAMANLVQNYQTFGTGGAAITGFSRRFLTALPADDQPLSAADAFATNDPTVARFVQVNLTDGNRRSISTFFAPVIGGGSTAAAGAVAIAGFTSAVCKFTPLFICNPYETVNPSLAHLTSQIEQRSERRKLIALKKSGNGASLAPGNFGFLQSDLGPGAAALKDSLARSDPGSCFQKDGVETQTGAVNSARHAINTRFDIYEANFNGVKNDSAYRPARNVTKGYTFTGNACNAELDESIPPVAMGFPRDSVIDSGTRMGNGDWGDVNPGSGVHYFDEYWDINHPGVSPPNGWSSANLPTRYEVYRWEIESSPSRIPNNVGGENGNPQCSSSAVNDNPDRRIIYGAALNCNALALQGGSGGTVPALAFIKMFMTEPMTKLPGTGLEDEDDTLYVELVDVVDPGSAGQVVHDIVQLYR